MFATRTRTDIHYQRWVYLKYHNLQSGSSGTQSTTLILPFWAFQFKRNCYAYPDTSFHPMKDQPPLLAMVFLVGVSQSGVLLNDDLHWLRKGVDAKMVFRELLLYFRSHGNEDSYLLRGWLICWSYKLLKWMWLRQGKDGKGKKVNLKCPFLFGNKYLKGNLDKVCVESKVKTRLSYSFRWQSD